MPPRSSPPAPRPVSDRESAGASSTSGRAAITIWAMRSPRFTANGSCPALNMITPTSPRYPASIVPGELVSIRLCLSARPLRGRTCASYPGGSSMKSPVGTRTLRPGGSSSSARERRSKAASSGCALAGARSAQPSAILILICNFFIFFHIPGLFSGDITSKVIDVPAVFKYAG